MGLTWILGVLAVIFTPLVVYGTLGGEGLLIFSVAAVVGTFPSLISWIFHVKALSWILRTFLSIAGIVIWRWTSDIPFLSELGVGHMGLGVALGLILTPWILHAFGSTNTEKAGQLTFRKKRIQKWLHLTIPEGSWYWVPWPLRVHETSEDAAQKAVDKRNATSSPTASAPTTEASNPLPWVIGGGAFILLVILALLFSGGSSDEKKEGAQKKAQQEVSPPSAQKDQPVEQPIEALIFVTECWTPCNAYIGYKYKIRGEGNPLRIIFWNIDKPIDYPGEGDFKTPKDFQPGDTKFTSLNKLRPHVRVQIYKKINVLGGQ